MVLLRMRGCTKSRCPARLGKYLVLIRLGKIGDTRDDCFNWSRVVYYCFLRGHARSG